MWLFTFNLMFQRSFEYHKVQEIYNKIAKSYEYITLARKILN